MQKSALKQRNELIKIKYMLQEAGLGADLVDHRFPV